MTTPALSFSGLTIGYGQRILLEDATGALPAGSLTALLGRNGSGKSSMIRVLAGINPPLKGSIQVCGHDLSTMNTARRARHIALVTTERIRVSNLRCRDLVALGRSPYTNWIGHMRPEDEEIVGRALQLTGMQAYADRTIDRMSDGECQRIMIARALAQDTPVILLDEPTSYLDLPNRYELCTLLRQMAKDQNRTILFSTHELVIALKLADNIALIDTGEPTPTLRILPSADMATSGHINRLFHIPA